MLRGIKGMGVLPTAAKQHYPTQNNRRASCARETLAKITHTETEKKTEERLGQIERVENTREKNIEQSLAQLIHCIKFVQSAKQIGDGDIIKTVQFLYAKVISLTVSG